MKANLFWDHGKSNPFMCCQAKQIRMVVVDKCGCRRTWTRLFRLVRLVAAMARCGRRRRVLIASGTDF